MVTSRSALGQRNCGFSFLREVSRSDMFNMCGEEEI